MIGWFGLGAIGIALGGALLLIWRGAPALIGRESVPVGRLRVPVLALLGGAIAAMVAIEFGLLTDDFSLAYVANNHRIGTPLTFTIASGWAALEGSIVLWGLVLAVFTFTVFRQAEGAESDDLAVGALAVLGMISVFFFGLMATVANPFEVCVQAGDVGCQAAGWAPWSVAHAPLNGRGANPLLQNHILMAIHPPMLYVGYVGLSVPFAFAIASLGGVHRGSAWLIRTRRWTLTAWSFLTTGIVLGAWWSYAVLGWGGYWAWDPVENASFIPWLLATAFIHSAVVQARRGVLQAWNYVLVIGTFAATILGTFLTRSGVIASVHSFTQSAIGPALLGFLAIVLVGSLVLFTMRLHLVASAPRLDSLVSREGMFLLNNLLLAVFAFVVLVGTLFPLLVEAFQGSTVGVGRPFFDRWAVPLSFALILAMGIGPVTPYRVARPVVVWDRIRIPLLLALASAALLVLFITRNGHMIVMTLLSTFVIAVIVHHLWQLADRQARSRSGTRRHAVLRLAQGDPGYWGGQIAHIGIAVLALGIAASANLVTSSTIGLAPGESARFAGYELVYQAPFTRQEPNRTVIGALIEVRRDGERIAVLEPRLNQYTGSLTAIQTPAIHSTFMGDLYISPTRLDASGVTADVWAYPMQWMIWLGGLLAAAGAGFSLLAIRRSRDSQVLTRA